MSSNEIRNLVISGIEATRRSGVPVLFLSNPGLGKTSTVNEWAKRNGYHVESLIGSAFDRSEVQGYMVNTGKDYLDLLKPFWFQSILDNEAKGIPSILFIDELSTAPSDVQGSLFRLIFERVDGAGRKLPDSTLIISAANYKGNLPPQFDISAPALNRFCIINLRPTSLNSFLDECLQSEDSRLSEWPTYDPIENWPEDDFSIRESISQSIRGLFEGYEGDDDSSAGVMEVNNTYLEEIYDAPSFKDGTVLNFASFRTISYLSRMLLTSAKYGIADRNWLYAMSDGLVGLAFNSFKDTVQVGKWRRDLHKKVTLCVTSILRSLKTEDEEEEIDTSAEDIFEENASLSAKIDTFKLIMDSKQPKPLQTSVLKNIVESINSEFPTSRPDYVLKTVKKYSLRSEKRASAIADFYAVKGLLDIIPDYIETSVRTSAIKTIDDVVRLYRTYIDTYQD